MTQRSDIRVQLLPHKRAVLQKWNATPDVQDQLEALAPDVDVATIKLTPVELDWLIGDLNHAVEATVSSSDLRIDMVDASDSRILFFSRLRRFSRLASLRIAEC